MIIPSKEKKGLWDRILDDDESIRHLLRHFPNGPILRTLDVFREDEENETRALEILEFPHLWEKKGVLAQNMGRSILYAWLATVLGAVITSVLLIAPPLVHAEMLMVDYILPNIVSQVVLSLIFSLFVSLLDAIFGSLESDVFLWACFCFFSRRVDFFIAKGASDWELGREGAAAGNQRELYNFFLRKLRLIK